MSFFSRFSAILIAIMLSSLGISKNTYEQALASTLQEIEGAISTTSELAEKRLNDAFGIQPQHEIVVSSGHNLPVPGSKIHLDALLRGLFSAELKIGSFASSYLSQAKKICPSLSGTAVIFPFHYFW